MGWGKFIGTAGLFGAYKEPSIYAVSKQKCLSIGNDLATVFPYSMNKITL